MWEQGGGGGRGRRGGGRCRQQVMTHTRACRLPWNGSAPASQVLRCKGLGCCCTGQDTVSQAAGRALAPIRLMLISLSRRVIAGCLGPPWPPIRRITLSRRVTAGCLGPPWPPIRLSTRHQLLVTQSLVTSHSSLVTRRRRWCLICLMVPDLSHVG